MAYSFILMEKLVPWSYISKHFSEEEAQRLETCKFQLKMMKLKNVVTVVKFTKFRLYFPFACPYWTIVNFTIVYLA